MKGKLINPRPLYSEAIPYNVDSEHAQFFSRRSLFSTLKQGRLEIECFERGVFLGRPLSERILRRGWIEEANSKIGDFLPYCAVSTWYFTAKKGTTRLLKK